MEIKLSFLGAARNVTGSCYLIEANGSRVIVDCGLYQERDFKSRNWDAFAVPPNTVDAVLLTHGHLDHCGRLPRLVNQGFSGPIYATPATADITEIVLRDSAKIQEEDIAHKIKRHERQNRRSPYPYEPLYTIEDVEATLPHLGGGVQYEKPVDVANGMQAVFHEGGHILGSASIELRVSHGGESRSIMFSGDVGRWDTPIIQDPRRCGNVDYVLIESTYGNRVHESNEEIPDKLAGMINSTVAARGRILIPSFSVERTQELLYHLNNLLNDGRIPDLKVFVDSPMAVKVTEVFRRHPELFDADTLEHVRRGDHPCDFPGLIMCRTVEESKAINHLDEPCIVIAGSGMCTGGRIKHHLAHGIDRPENTILFVGYQAVGTLGRLILERKTPLRIIGREFELKARVAKVNGFSAHADRNELLKWLTGMTTPPRRVFVTHGEEEAAEDFAAFVADKTHWPVSVAAYQQQVVLS